VEPTFLLFDFFGCGPLIYRQNMGLPMCAPASPRNRCQQSNYTCQKKEGREIGFANLPKKQPAVCLPILQLVVK
jgi:hypothetical protein